MNSNNVTRLLGVFSGALLAAGCAGGVGSDAESRDLQPAVEAKSSDPAVSAVGAQDKKALAVAAGSCVAQTSGRTMQQLIDVPGGAKLECTTVGNTSLDTVLVLMHRDDPTSAQGPCDSPYTDQKHWMIDALNDDAQGTNQSTVTWQNNGGATKVRLVGFLYSGMNGGNVNVTCTTNGVATTYTGNFASGSCRGVPSSSTVYTSAGSGDTTLLAVLSNFSNQNSQSNDDCTSGSTPSPGSCLQNMTTGMTTWFVDLGCFGSLPRSTTINY